MSVVEADIERIVSAVLKQLGATQRVAAPIAPVTVPVAAPKAPGTSELVIDTRVVTLESVKGRLNGAKKLVVARGALVTPSVRDELRRRGVTLTEQCSANGSKQSLAPVLCVAARTSSDPAMAIEMLRLEGLDVRSESTACLVEATRKLAEAAAGRTLSILWTPHTAAGLCLANRHASIRAVLAGNVAATAAAIAAVGANVLVIDPTVGTLYEKKQVLRDFCLGGVRECPDELKESLVLGS